MTTSPLRIIVIGAGSMGTRRLRDLAYRKDVALAVFDERADRRERARERFGIAAYEDLAAAMAWEPTALVISTPPDQHAQYVDLALDRRLHHFCEAHIWTPDACRIDEFGRQEGLVCASSCTMDFLPVVRRLRELVAGEVGAVHAYQMYLSTWLPGWHPTEPGGFYAWRPATTAAREMVPFELLYLNTIFGTPVAVAGTLARRGELAVDGPDMWCLQMQLENGGCGQLTVIMGSPAEARRRVLLRQFRRHRV